MKIKPNNPSKDAYRVRIRRYAALATVICAKCKRSSTFKWNADRDGYIAYCPHCGAELRICSECRRERCDYNSYTGDCSMLLEGKRK